MTSTSVDRLNGARSSLAFKAPCKSASIANLVLSGEQTVDGVALVTGDRCLVKTQTSSVNNGIYVVDTGTWTRAPDADGNSDWTKGTVVICTNGATTSGFWQQSTAAPITIGTTAVVFVAASLGTVSAYMTTVLAAADATTAFALLAAAAISLPGDISPAALAANTNDWAPVGFSTASTIRMSSSIAINLTGIAAGVDGRLICLHNVGAFAITLKNAATSTAANQFQLSGDYVLNANSSTVLEYDSTSSKWRLFGQQGAQASVSFNRLLNNVGLTVTMNTNACTIALKDAAGADPTASSQCVINVRDGTLTNGKVNQRTVQAALSTVISSGSTGGTTNGNAARICVAAIDVGGTIELAWNNTTTAPDENALISTTAEGGIGAADSAGVWYSTTARASVAFTVLGYFEVTQAAAGTWVTAVTKIAINPVPYPVFTQITASLAADVLLNNTGTFFDGPSIAQGPVGVWFVIASGTFLDTAGSANFICKITDGTTTFASGVTNVAGTAVNGAITLFAIADRPVGNLRLSAKDITSTSGKMIFNASALSKDSTITAIRIA